MIKGDNSPTEISWIHTRRMPYMIEEHNKEYNLGKKVVHSWNQPVCWFGKENDNLKTKHDNSYSL
jgi:hypothetical protein